MADHFIIGMEDFLGDIAVFGGHGDDLFIIKRNPQLFCKAVADLPSAAAEFPADGYDFAHNFASLFDIVSLSYHTFCQFPTILFFFHGFSCIIGGKTGGVL